MKSLMVLGRYHDVLKPRPLRVATHSLASNFSNFAVLKRVCHSSVRFPLAMMLGESGITLANAPDKSCSALRVIPKWMNMPKRRSCHVFIASGVAKVQTSHCCLLKCSSNTPRLFPLGNSSRTADCASANAEQWPRRVIEPRWLDDIFHGEVLSFSRILFNS